MFEPDFGSFRRHLTGHLLGFRDEDFRGPPVPPPPPPPPGTNPPVGGCVRTSFSALRFQATVGDFDGDGRTDIGGLYEYANLNAGVARFRSAGSSFTLAVDWASGVNQWNVSSSKTF
jgi:hypothetical protein